MTSTPSSSFLGIVLIPWRLPLFMAVVRSQVLALYSSAEGSGAMSHRTCWRTAGRTALRMGRRHGLACCLRLSISLFFRRRMRRADSRLISFLRILRSSSVNGGPFLLPPGDSAPPMPFSCCICTVQQAVTRGLQATMLFSSCICTVLQPSVHGRQASAALDKCPMKPVTYRKAIRKGRCDKVVYTWCTHRFQGLANARPRGSHPAAVAAAVAKERRQLMA